MTLHLALAQKNATVGHLEANARCILETAQQAVDRGASVLVFPELFLSGYPPEDLVLKKHVLEDCRLTLEHLAAALPPDLITLVGSPLEGPGGRAVNSALVLHGGGIVGRYDKVILPNYGVFDEKRVFEPGTEPGFLRVGEYRFALHICEDSWEVAHPPLQSCAGKDLDLVLNLSASPYHRGKFGLRESVFRRAAAQAGAPIACCNLVGGQDELVFDGASMLVDASNGTRARARFFEEDLLWVSLPDPVASPASPPLPGPAIDRPASPTAHPPPPPAACAPHLEDPAEVYAALRLGLHDYVVKNGFDKVVVAVSGGIDSALALTLAADALGPARVVGVTMPSQYSSTGTRSDASALAHNLGIELHTLPIQSLYDAFLHDLEPLFAGRPPDAAEENLQARIRGNLIMALSNKFNWMVLTTGNKSELATGYCTLYGDMAGGFAVLKDVPKTLVYALSRWRNTQEDTPVIPPSTIERAPSAELRADQKDSDSLPPYDVLDAILELYVERDLGVDAIVARGFAADTVCRVIGLVERNEYKRRQAPPGIKITPKAFGRDRRIPITNLYRERPGAPLPQEP